jgi:hypothetical protein
MPYEIIIESRNIYKAITHRSTQKGGNQRINAADIIYSQISSFQNPPHFQTNTFSFRKLEKNGKVFFNINNSKKPYFNPIKKSNARIPSTLLTFF